MSKSFLKLSWYSDLKAESDLQRMAVAYEVESIPFSKLDLKESQVNGARLNDAIRNHKVEDYMQGFRNGDTFPRPVVYLTPTGYVILGGNQRCEAIRRLIADGELPKSASVECYVVDTNDKLLLEIIARSGNVAHGEGDTKEERLQHAIHCCKRLGMATKDAAKSFQVSQATITHRMRAESQRIALEKAGVDTVRVPASALEPLEAITFDENTKIKVGSLIAQHGVPAERVRQVVGLLKKQTSAQGRMQVVRDFEKELSAVVHSKNGKSNGTHVEQKVPSRPRRDKFITLAQRLSSFLENGNDGEAFTGLEQLQVSTEQDTELAIKAMRKLQFRIGVLLK